MPQSSRKNTIWAVGISLLIVSIAFVSIAIALPAEKAPKEFSNENGRNNNAASLQAPAPMLSSASTQALIRERFVRTAPASVSISVEAQIAYVVVKFRDGAGVRMRSGSFVSEKGFPIAKSKELLERFSAVGLRPLFAELTLATEREKSALEEKSKQRLADLGSYYRVEITDNVAAQTLINSLNGLPEIELAYFMPGLEVAGDIAPPTPAFDTAQLYLGPAPGGVDAQYAKTQAGGDGSGIKIIDVEVGWNTTHEDLDAAANAFFVFGNNSPDNHGTAVLGEMVGSDNAYGVTGICPAAQVGMISVSAMSAAEAFLLAGENLGPGDIMLIELHAPGPRFGFTPRSDQLGYVCLEYWQAEYDAIQYLWARGITVIEAAGNGAENYDDTALYGPLFDTTYRNSHAILAGAGAPPNDGILPDRTRLSFSCYGERVNLQGYGRKVVTTGYGNLFNGGGDINQRYTATFSGTSSASPIVAGAVACLQGRYKSLNGVTLSSDQIRDILTATGTPQFGAISENIGPRPDLKAAILSLTAPPALYTNEIFLDTIVQQGQSADLSLYVVNRSPVLSVDFSISAQDSIALLSAIGWLSASPSAGNLAPLDSLELIVTLDASVVDDSPDPYWGLLRISWGISGGGGGPLDSLALVPVFMTVPCFDTSYLARSSDSVSGPNFEWIEITQTGEKIPQNVYYNQGSAPLDDGSAGPFFLGFDFPFFGVNYNEVWVGVNGAISFSDSAVNSNGFFDQLSIPGAPFSTFVSPFWNDLTIDPLGGGHGDIFFKRLPNFRFAISWNQIGNFNSAADTLVSFQVILEKNGDISANYLNVGTSGLSQTALIGLQSAGCSVESYYDQGVPASLEVSDSSSLLFEYKEIVTELAGDANRSGSVDIGDATFLVAYIFKNGAAPDPIGSGDPNCSGGVDISDASFIVLYVFGGGATPCDYQL